MSARVEAAAKAILDLRADKAWFMRSEAEVALTAADAVMFDESAVERVASKLAEFRRFVWCGWLPDDMREGFRNEARAVIAALKGDDK